MIEWIEKHWVITIGAIVLLYKSLDIIGKLLLSLRGIEKKDDELQQSLETPEKIEPVVSPSAAIEMLKVLQSYGNAFLEKKSVEYGSYKLWRNEIAIVLEKTFGRPHEIHGYFLGKGYTNAIISEKQLKKNLEQMIELINYVKVYSQYETIEETSKTQNSVSSISQKENPANKT